MMELMARLGAWTSNFRARMRDPADRARVIAAAMSLPAFIAASVITSVIGLIAWVSVNPDWLSCSDYSRGRCAIAYSGVVLAMAVAGEAGFLLLLRSRFPWPTRVNGRWGWRWLFFAPFMAHAIDANGGVGLPASRRRLADRVGGNGEFIAWLRSAGIGLVLAGVLFGLAQGLGALIQLFTGPVKAGSGSIMSQTTQVLSMATSELLRGSSPHPVLAALTTLIVIVIGPFLEECLFRGVIARSLALSSIGSSDLVGAPTGDAADPRRVVASPVRQALVSVLAGAVFGVAHAQFTGSPTVDASSVLVPWLMGSVLSWLSSYKFDSIVPTFFAHMFYNTITMVAALLLAS
jgi:membrane protease YdiL (CAAX protease family)